MLLAVNVLLNYLAQATILASVFCGSVCIVSAIEVGCNEYYLYKKYMRPQAK